MAPPIEPTPDASTVPADPDAQRLADAAKALGIALTLGQVQKLLAYRALLLSWNRVHNLTALRTPDEALTHHLFDCLAVVPPLLRHVAGLAWHSDGADAEQAPGTAARALRLPVLEVGAGGGLPGVVIAVTCPQVVQVTCVDSVAKKMAFVHQVAAQLQLTNLSAQHRRVETLREPTFALITSRAFAALPDFVRLTEPCLQPEGVWMAMKGRVPDEEIAALPPGIDVFHVEPLSVPGLAAQRCIVWMRRKPAGATS